jgi:hypothetical protein
MPAPARQQRLHEGPRVPIHDPRNAPSQMRDRNEHSRSPEHGDGVDGVEEEMRVDLRLERLELHASGKFRLLSELREFELRREERGETLRHCDLCFVEQSARSVVELERADRDAAHLKRHDDGSTQHALAL